MGLVNARGIVVSVLLMLILAGLGVCLFVDEWYYFEEKAYGQGDFTETRTAYGLKSGSRVSEEDNQTETSTVEYGGNGTKYMSEKFETAFLVAIIGIILTGITVILGLISGFRLIPGWIGTLVGLLAVVAIIASPVYLWFVLPEAWMKDSTVNGETPYYDGPWEGFMGTYDRTEEDGTSIELAWGPSYAFFTMLVLGVVAAILCFVLGSVSTKDESYEHQLRRRGDDYDVRRQERRYDEHRRRVDRERRDRRGGRDRYDDRGGRDRYDDRGGRDRYDDRGGRDRYDDRGHDRGGGRDRRDRYDDRLDKAGGGKGRRGSGYDEARQKDQRRSGQGSLGPSLGPVPDDDSTKAGRYGDGAKKDHYEREKGDYGS